MSRQESAGVSRSDEANGSFSLNVASALNSPILFFGQRTVLQPVKTGLIIPIGSILVTWPCMG